MSGIDNIKKKSKISLEEMFDNQQVVKTEIQENGNPEIRENVKTELSKNGNPDVREYGNTEKQEYRKKIDKMERNETYHFPSLKNGKTKEKMDCKLTFNVNEDTFKAFNEVYAKRILEGKKTDKSVLICEAIKLLFERES